MKKSLLLLLGISCALSVSALNSVAEKMVDYNPLDNEILNGPVRRVVTMNHQMRNGKEMPAEKIIKKKQGKYYNEEIYDKDGHIVEFGHYENKVAKILQTWTQSELSEYVYRSNYLNRKRQIYNDKPHEVVAYNPDGTIMQIVHIADGVIKSQMEYEYNSNGQIKSECLIYGKKTTLQQESYKYDNQGRLVDYRNYYSSFYGYKLHYSDSLVTKEILNRDEVPEKEFYYLDAQGRVVKKVHIGGVYGIYEEYIYSKFDQYGNWTELLKRSYRHDAYKVMVDEDRGLWFAGKEKRTSRTIRQIEYFE